MATVLNAELLAATDRLTDTIWKVRSRRQNFAVTPKSITLRELTGAIPTRSSADTCGREKTAHERASQFAFFQQMLGQKPRLFGSRRMTESG